MGDDECHCRIYELMMERTPTYHMQEENWPLDQGVEEAHGFFQGQGREQGGGPSRGHDQIVCYNYGQSGHFVQDYPNPTQPSCPYTYSLTMP